MGDYFTLYTYRYTGNDMMPYLAIDNFLINTKTNTCVAASLNGTLSITELGMLLHGSDGLYRVEDGGTTVKILENPNASYVIGHGRIYYMPDLQRFQLNIIDHLSPAPLPTKSIY